MALQLLLLLVSKAMGFWLSLLRKERHCLSWSLTWETGWQSFLWLYRAWGFGFWPLREEQEPSQVWHFLLRLLTPVASDSVVEQLMWTDSRAWGQSLYLVCSGSRTWFETSSTQLCWQQLATRLQQQSWTRTQGWRRLLQGWVRRATGQGFGLWRALGPSHQSQPLPGLTSPSGRVISLTSVYGVCLDIGVCCTFRPVCE